MIIDMTQTKIEHEIASILGGEISYSSQRGFFLTWDQRCALFWGQMKEWEAQVIAGDYATVEEAAGGER